MNLTKAQLQEITEMAAAFMSPEEVELIMQLPGLSDLVKNPETAEYRAYMAGYLESKFKVRKNLVEMAKNGSSPAQTACENLIKDHEWQNLKH